MALSSLPPDLADRFDTFKVSVKKPDGGSETIEVRRDHAGRGKGEKEMAQAQSIAAQPIPPVEQVPQMPTPGAIMPTGDLAVDMILARGLDQPPPQELLDQFPQVPLSPIGPVPQLNFPPGLNSFPAPESFPLPQDDDLSMFLPPPASSPSLALGPQPGPPGPARGPLGGQGVPVGIPMSSGVNLPPEMNLPPEIDLNSIPPVFQGPITGFQPPPAASTDRIPPVGALPALSDVVQNRTFGGASAVADILGNAGVFGGPANFDTSMIPGAPPLGGETAASSAIRQIQAGTAGDGTFGTAASNLRDMGAELSEQSLDQTFPLGVVNSTLGFFADQAANVLGPGIDALAGATVTTRRQRLSDAARFDEELQAGRVSPLADMAEHAAQLIQTNPPAGVQMGEQINNLSGQVAGGIVLNIDEKIQEIESNFREAGRLDRQDDFALRDQVRGEALAPLMSRRASHERERAQLRALLNRDPSFGERLGSFINTPMGGPSPIYERNQAILDRITQLDRQIALDDALIARTSLGVAGLSLTTRREIETDIARLYGDVFDGSSGSGGLGSDEISAGQDRLIENQNDFSALLDDLRTPADLTSGVPVEEQDELAYGQLGEAALQAGAPRQVRQVVDTATARILAGALGNVDDDRAANRREKFQDSIRDAIEQLRKGVISSSDLTAMLSQFRVEALEDLADAQR